MGKLRLKIHHHKIVHLARQSVTKDFAEKVESFALRNGFEVVQDYKGIDTRYIRYELDRKVVGSPFIFIDSNEDVHVIGGKIGSKHADLFLEEFGNE